MSYVIRPLSAGGWASPTNDNIRVFKFISVAHPT